MDELVRARESAWELGFGSAHRMQMRPEYAEERGCNGALKVLICGRASPASPPGVVAAQTELPFWIGRAARSSMFRGSTVSDALLSIVQNAPGRPVADGRPSTTQRTRARCSPHCGSFALL